jgi:hypothetical protein
VPSKEDKQLVDVKFALMKGFSPNCIGSSGRQWFIPNFNDIQKFFELYKNIYMSLQWNLCDPTPEFSDIL